MRAKWVHYLGVGWLTACIGWAQPTLALGRTSAPPRLWHQAGTGGGFTVASTPNPLLFHFSVVVSFWSAHRSKYASVKRANGTAYSRGNTIHQLGEPGVISSHTGNAWVILNSSAGAASDLYQVASRGGTTSAPPTPSVTSPPSASTGPS